MLVAKLPGSIKAIEATTAGPKKERYARKSFRSPASTSRAARAVRSESDSRASGAMDSVISSCSLEAPGSTSSTIDLTLAAVWELGFSGLTRVALAVEKEDQGR